jgi:hypothetical protein
MMVALRRLAFHARSQYFEEVAMPIKRQLGECNDGHLEDLAADPTCPVEFDSRLNEYHITREGGGHFMIYYCPLCGGSVPESRRDQLFHKLTEIERRRLIDLTQNLKTLDEVLAAFGPPDCDQPTGFIKVIPERDGKPETTERFRVLIYEKLSDTANVRVTVYPTDRVGIGFQGKAKKKRGDQTAE